MINTDAKKFTVSDMLTVGKQYDVINETEEYYQIIDNSGLVGGYYKTYFKEVLSIIKHVHDLIKTWGYFEKVIVEIYSTLLFNATS